MWELILVDTERKSEEEAENARREHNILINSLIKVIIMLVLQKKWAVDMISVLLLLSATRKLLLIFFVAGFVGGARVWVCVVRYALHFLNNRWIRSEFVLFITKFLYMDWEKIL